MEYSLGDLSERRIKFCEVLADHSPSNVSSSWASPLLEDVTTGGLVSARPDKET